MAPSLLGGADGCWGQRHPFAPSPAPVPPLPQQLRMEPPPSSIPLLQPPVGMENDPVATLLGDGGVSCGAGPPTVPG